MNKAVAEKQQPPKSEWISSNAVSARNVCTFIYGFEITTDQKDVRPGIQVIALECGVRRRFGFRSASGPPQTKKNPKRRRTPHSKIAAAQPLVVKRDRFGSELAKKVPPELA